MAEKKFLVNINTDGDVIANGVTLTGQSDWNATSGGSEILNKPTAAADLTNHYLKVSLTSTHLKGGASAIDFDNASNTQVTGFAQDDISGTFISFADDKFTVSEDGMYTFNISAEFESLVTQRAVPTVTFKLNGTTIDGKSMGYIRQASNADEATVNLSRTLILSSSDEIEVFAKNQGVTNGASTTPSLMFMAEAYSNSMTVTGIAGAGEDNVQSDWNETDTGADSHILNKPSIPTAFSGVYNDLSGKPTLAPSTAEQNVQSDWNATTGDALILNKPTIPTNNNELTNGENYITGVNFDEIGGTQSDLNLSAFTNDLTLAPSNAEQNVQSNWNETNTGNDAHILNKPDTVFKYSIGTVSSDRNMVAADRDAFLNNDNEVTLTFQNDSTWSVPIGSTGKFVRVEDDGQFYIAAGTGVTFNFTSITSFAINGASSENTAIADWVKVAANAYWITGDLAEA